MLWGWGKGIIEIHHWNKLYYLKWLQSLSKRLILLQAPPTSDPDLLWSSDWEPLACRGPRTATFRLRPSVARGCLPALPILLRARGVCGGVEVARGGLGSAPGIALGGAWTGAARRPALLAPSPHSFVLARGSWRCRGRAAPPTWLGAGLGEARCECARGSLGRGRGAGEAGRGASEVGSGAGGTRAKPHEEDSSSGLPPHLLHGEPRSTVSTFVPGGWGFIVFRSRALLDSWNEKHLRKPPNANRPHKMGVETLQPWWCWEGGPQFECG